MKETRQQKGTRMEKKKDTKVRRLTATAVSAAVVFVVTWLVKIPLPVSGGAYLNFGDAAIFFCAFVLGGPWAAASAGIGSALADLVGGAPLYAVPTFVIKFLMGLTAGALNSSQRFMPYLVSCVVGSAIMICGYAAFEWGAFGSALATAVLPFNLIQAVGSVLVAAVLFRAAHRLSSALGLRSLNQTVLQPARH